jgi:peptidyl-prolyl cis-trans isomerase D
MLEQMRKASQSLLIYLLFFIVIAVFVINFGPQSRGSSCDQVMKGNDHYAAQINGETVTQNDFRYGFMLAGGAQIPAPMAKRDRLKEAVMDKLIEREILAAEADRLGYVVTDEEVEDQIADAKIIGLGSIHTVPRLQKDGKFNYDSFKNFLQLELSVTPKAFVEEQKKELLALRVRDLLRASVTVSADELKNDFIRKNRQVNLEYLRFSGRRFEPEVVLTDAEIADYAAKNDAKLQEAYDQKRFVYEKVPDERRVRQILIKVPHDAPADVDQAAHAKADALSERLKKGAKAGGKEGLTFMELAKAASEDTTSKARGGDLGWRARGAVNLPAALEDKIWQAKPGAVIGPLRGTDGYVISKIEGAREGNISYDKAKLELAEEKLREARGNAQAKAAADAALAKLEATPAKSMKDLFPAPADNATGDKDNDKESAAAPDSSAVPRVEETGLFALRATREGIVIEGIGVSSPLAKAAFALTAEAPLAGPFDVNGTSIVVRLKERKDPDLAEFEKHRIELARDAELTKWERVLTDWVQARCVEAKDGKRINVNTDVLRYEDSSDPPPYEPCVPHRQFGG